MAGYWTEDKMDSMIVEYRSTYGNVDEMCYSDHAKKDRYEQLRVEALNLLVVNVSNTVEHAQLRRILLYPEEVYTTLFLCCIYLHTLISIG